MSFCRSTMRRRPSGSNTLTSPVRRWPSGQKASAVAVGWHRMPHMRRHCSHKAPPQWPEQVTQARNNGLRHAQPILHRGGGALQHHDGNGAAVLKLVRLLTRGVERVDVDGHFAGAHQGQLAGQVGRRAGHHQRYACAARQPQRGESGRQCRCRWRFRAGTARTRGADLGCGRWPCAWLVSCFLRPS